MRLQQEAKNAFSLSHKNLSSVHDISQTSDGLSYLVMDFANGQTLSDLCQSRPIEPTKAIEIFSQVAEGLRAAHSQGVIHRDIKPSNIMVETLPSGSYHVKIVDFGIAKKVIDDADEIQKLTQTGEIFGTPLYMSPEQCRAESLDARSDIYSFGCVLYEALTGVPPFKGDSPVSTVLQHLEKTAAAPDKQLRIPQPLLRLVNKCLEKDSKDRYQTMGDLVTDLQAIKSGGTTANVPYARLPARIKARLIDSLIVATAGGLLLLPRPVLIYFSDIGQMQGTSFDEFVRNILFRVYIIGFGIGFSEGWLPIFSIFFLIVELIFGLPKLALGNSTYALLGWPELVALAVFNWMFHAAFEASEWQGTPGKMILNLRVTTSDGRRLSFRQASLRHLGSCLLSLCTVTILPLVAVAINLCRQRRWSQFFPVVSDLGNSLSHCHVRERHTSTGKSRALLSAALTIGVTLPFVGIVTVYQMAHGESEIALPAKINTPPGIPASAYKPVSQSARIVTGFLLDPSGREPEHLKRVWTTEASKSAEAFGLPVSIKTGNFAKSLHGIDLTEINIGEARPDRLIPVVVVGNLHMIAGKQTWMATQYKRVPFSISYLMRWDQANTYAEPDVVRVTEFGKI